MTVRPPSMRFKPTEWPRLYPPLLMVLLAVLLAVFTLPSALNLPQANPSQVAVAKTIMRAVRRFIVPPLWFGVPAW